MAKAEKAQLSTAHLEKMLQQAYIDGKQSVIDTIDESTKEAQAVLNPAVYQFIVGTVVPTMRDQLNENKKAWGITT